MEVKLVTGQNLLRCSEDCVHINILRSSVYEGSAHEVSLLTLTHRILGRSLLGSTQNETAIEMLCYLCIYGLLNEDVELRNIEW